jgi:polyhydroxyalkanoate synthesis regulator phasin
VYLQLIGEDRTLTDRLDRGEITRTERRQRLDQLIERIRNAEREKIRAEQQRLTDYMDQQLDEVMRAHHRLEPF